MKRTIAWMLALTLLLCVCTANAETVTEQINAPERVRDTFTSNTGKTVITVDARVTVPDAEAMYLIPVTSVAFDDALVPVLAELIWPGLGKKKVKIEEGNTTCSVEGRMVKGYWSHSATIDRYATKNDDTHVQNGSYYSCLADMEGVYDCGLSSNIQYDTRYRLKQTINYDNPYMDEEVTGEGIEGHPLTSAQAIKICETFIKGLTNEPFELFAIGKAPGTIHDDKRILAGTQRTGTGYSYTLAFTRQVEGAPLLPCMWALMNAASYRDDLYTLPVGYEQILMAINLEGQVTCFSWKNPYDISDARDTQTLLPFEQIHAIARQMMPLKYQWREKNGGEVTMHVDRVSLGYMALLQRDKLSFALTPVWNYYGALENSPFEESMQPLLTVNAVDGTVVDLYYGY